MVTTKRKLLLLVFQINIIAYIFAINWLQTYHEMDITDHIKGIQYRNRFSPVTNVCNMREGKDYGDWNEIPAFLDIHLPPYPKGVETKKKKLIYIFNYKQGSKPFAINKFPPFCEITRDPLVKAKADAVFFHFLGYRNNELSRFSPNQIYVGMNLESPESGGPLRELNISINWTMTYRRDSDIYYPYGLVLHRVKRDSSESVAETFPKIEIDKRTKTVAWAVGHCNKKNGRMDYARELSKYIDVDIYGKCSPNKLKCPDGCLENISKSYKFWLSFENSHCKDYITEKLYYNAFYYGLVPIIYGGFSKQDYQYVAPNNSYIDVRDFQTPKGALKLIIESFFTA